MNSSLLLSRVSEDDALLVVSVDASAFSEMIAGWKEARLTVRVARGRKMTDSGNLMDEFAAALQFPHYFGENWPAFQECLEDMDWLPAGEGYVIAITDAADVLSNAPESDLRLLVRSFAQAHATYANPIVEGEWWDRPALPFHVVLQVKPGDENALDSWVHAGASLKRPELA